MIVGSIDLGTNTVLLLIAELRGTVLVPLVDLARITRLGEGVDRTRSLAPEAVQRTLAVLEEYARELRARGVALSRAVGTSALRDARGGEGFLDAAQEILGFRPEVIDGETEAELTFAGALSGLELGSDVCVFDVGGGSTEVITGRAGPSAVLSRARSLDVGSVRLFERHVHHDPPRPDELARVGDDVERALTDAPRPSPGAVLVGVAGTVTTLAAIHMNLTDYDPNQVHGSTLSLEAVEELAARLAAMPLHARRSLAGLSPKRADVIPVGAEIVRRVLGWSGEAQVLVSDRGVRWGVAERLTLTDTDT